MFDVDSSSAAAIAPGLSQAPTRTQMTYDGLVQLEEAIVLNEAAGWVLQCAGHDAGRDGHYWAVYVWASVAEPSMLL